MSDPSLTRVIVTIADQQLTTLPTVAIALQSAGLQVDTILSGIGIITGTVDPSRLPELKRVPGVVEIELDQEMQAI